MMIYRGNRGILCKSIIESTERGGVTFIEPDSTYCLMNQTFHWFNSTDTIPLRQLERMKQLHSECPTIPGVGSCKCEQERMTYLSVCNFIQNNSFQFKFLLFIVLKMFCIYFRRKVIIHNLCIGQKLIAPIWD